ncbi:hypothetical protein RhiirA4_517782 [Rhizophagus irregularis]|uniref:Uncharacterized protein n=1 Tax=Rhizophagus irregularis TaxID=588596 RepID=A0A2I1GGK2_9GLOM|nr:hypothetical protein RhiirA4_517782 [Rhizophagus irregularis]
MIENFPVTYIEWGTFSEKIPRNNPPQKSFPLNIKEEFDSILDTLIGINFRSKYCNLTAISLGWKIVGREYTHKPAIVFYVIRKDIIPIGDDLLPKTINGIDTDVREGFYEPTGFADSEFCREYSTRVSSGCSIGICDSRAGTLGAFVRNSNGHIYLLSNCHVLCSDDNRQIKHIVKQPAYIDHVGAIENKIDGKREMLGAEYGNNEIERLEAELITARDKDTKFARFIVGIRDNCIVNGKSYGVDAAIASLELINNNRKNDIRPKDFSIPKSAFEKYSLKVPFQFSKAIDDVNSFDTSKSIFKVGRTTGLTKGRIPDLIGTSFSSNKGPIYENQLLNLGGVRMKKVNNSEGRTIFQPKWLDRQIVALQKGDGSFMEKGDSGCIWFDQNGMILALGHGYLKEMSQYMQ